MDPTTIEREIEKIKELVAEAAQHKDAGDSVSMENAAESVAAHLQWMRSQGVQPPEWLLNKLKDAFRFFGYSEEEIDERLSSLPASRQKKHGKKIDLTGKSSGGTEHGSSEGESTRNKHEEGQATKGQDYGGEKGDARRGYPGFGPRDTKGHGRLHWSPLAR